MEVFDSLTGIVAVVFIFGLPVIAVTLAFITAMHRKAKDKEIRRLIIENHTDPETAKLLVAEPKKPKRELGPVDLGTLRTASILLGIGLGAAINWLCDIHVGNLYFWCLIAFGIGIGLLCSFLVEMKLYKKYGKEKSAEPVEE